MYSFGKDKIFVRASIVFFLITILASCASTMSLKKELNKNKIKVGVFSVDENKNNKYMLVALSNIENEIKQPSILDRLPWDSANVKVANREHLQKVVNEIIYERGAGIFSKEEQSNLRAMGIDVVIVFQIVAAKTKDNKFRSPDKMCITRKAYASLRIIAIRIDNGETILSNIYDKKNSTELCDKTRFPVDRLEFEDYYIARLLTKIASDFSSDFYDYL